MSQASLIRSPAKQISTRARNIVRQRLPVSVNSTSSKFNKDTPSRKPKNYASNLQNTDAVQQEPQQVLGENIEEKLLLTEHFGGDNGRGGNGRGDDGGGDGHQHGKGGDDMNAGLAILLAAGKSADQLPKELAKGVVAGKVSEEVMLRYLALENNLFYKFFLSFEGFRARLLADPSFMVKVGIECGIGIFTKSLAEYEKRKGNFSKELDFVFANVVMALIADFMLVWLPAPTLTSLITTPKTAKNVLQIFHGCPDNAFQTVAHGATPYTLIQRGGAIVRNGIKLLGVGFCSSLSGVGITNTLISVRQFFDPEFVPLHPQQNILMMSAAYASYMASSSNLRYQVVAGIIEERGVETIFRNNRGVCNGISLVVRTLNTFLGSLLWVDYIRLLGMQKSSTSDEK